jgi:hypothetical protein
MTPPPCDRHKNLQMVPFGRTDIDVCPVPSCGRWHDDQGYFEVVEGQLVREGKGAPTRIVEAREKILKTIRARAGA